MTLNIIGTGIAPHYPRQVDDALRRGPSPRGVRQASGNMYVSSWEVAMMDSYITIEPTILERPLKDSVRQYEREVIQAALKAYGDDKRRVAKLLDISLSSLYRKISDFDAPEHGVGEDLSAGGNGSRFPNN